jgi:hypothetical protein
MATMHLPLQSRTVQDNHFCAVQVMHLRLFESKLKSMLQEKDFRDMIRGTNHTDAHRGAFFVLPPALLCPLFICLCRENYHPVAISLTLMPWYAIL